MKDISRSLLAPALLCLALGGWAGAAPPDLLVSAPKVDVATPVDGPLPGKHEGPARLTPLTGDRARPALAQASSLGPWGNGGAWAGILLDPALTGAEQRFSVRPEKGPEARKGLDAFRFEEAENTYLRLTERDKPVLAYHFGKILPAGVPESFRRSCYVHPIHGLDGEVLTDDFPKDHFHHRGLFAAWPYVDLGGRKLDLWMCQGIETRFDKWLGRETGPVFAVFGVENGWYAGDRKAVKETAWYRIWAATEDGRALDVDLTWEATDAPVTLTGREQKGYGGLCLRFAPCTNMAIAANTGPLPKDTLDVPYAWADLSARFGGRPEPSGAAVFIDGRNPGFPNGWLIRHYGFLGVNWPGLGSVTLKPGEPVRVRYRVWIHRGDAARGKVAAAYQAFAGPLKLEFAK